jgi:hypothetical protein
MTTSKYPPKCSVALFIDTTEQTLPIKIKHGVCGGCRQMTDGNIVHKGGLGFTITFFCSNCQDEVCEDRYDDPDVTITPPTTCIIKHTPCTIRYTCLDSRNSFEYGFSECVICRQPEFEYTPAYCNVHNTSTIRTICECTNEECDVCGQHTRRIYRHSYDEHGKLGVVFRCDACWDGMGELYSCECGYYES